MITIYSLADLLTLDPPDWLIDDILPENGFNCLYGAPGEGKTFVALDMAMSVAAGLPWQGHTSRKAYVVYVSAEGGAGIGKRVAAWLDSKGIEQQDYPYLMIQFVTSAISVHPDSEDLMEVLSQTFASPEHQELLAGSLDDDEHQPLLIIIDTLARCLQGDENLQEDMGAFVRSVDAVREAYNATVLVIHHTNKGGFAERGSNSLRGACDAMLKVAADDTGIVTVSCDKQKDHAQFAPEAFHLQVVEEHDTCVLVRVEEATRQQQEEREAEEASWEAYIRAHPTLTIRQIAKDLGISVPTAGRRIKAIRNP